MEEGWYSELTRMGLVLAALALVGWLFDHPTLFLVLGLAVYLGWHFRQLAHLAHWLERRAVGAPPEARGTWGEVFFNITRIKRRYLERQRRLTMIVNRFRASATAMPDATVVLEADGRIEWFNKAAGTLLGLRGVADRGQRIDNLWRHPLFVEYLKVPDDYNIPLELPSPVDENVRLSVRVVPYGHDLRLLVVRDISRLYALERMRRDFVANVSHELRTPLTVISGYLESIAQGDHPPAQQKAFVTMQQQASRMRRIIDDLLMLSRLENTDNNTHPDTINVAAMLHAIADEARLLSGDKGHVIEVIADSALRITGNQKEIYSAFANLTFNAVHYTPPHGRIELTWRVAPEGIVCSVKDAGIGIAAHHIPRLTERFYRVDDSRSRASGGTGLGLAIVKHALARHGARLEIDSTPGVGSEFRCIFPMVRRAAGGLDTRGRA